MTMPQAAGKNGKTFVNPISLKNLRKFGNGIFPASIDPRKNISAFVASMEKSRLSEIKFIAGAR